MGVCVHCAVSGMACWLVLVGCFLVVSVVDGGGVTPGPFSNPEAKPVSR